MKKQVVNIAKHCQRNSSCKYHTAVTGNCPLWVAGNTITFSSQHCLCLAQAWREGRKMVKMFRCSGIYYKNKQAHRSIMRVLERLWNWAQTQTIKQLITFPPIYVRLVVRITKRLLELIEAERTQSMCYFLLSKSLVQNILRIFAATWNQIPAARSFK